MISPETPSTPFYHCLQYLIIIFHFFHNQVFLFDNDSCMKMKLLFSLLAVGIGVSREVQSAAARKLLPSTFVIPPLQSSVLPSQDSSTCPLFMAPPPTPTLQEIEAESEKLRKEIEELREEALRRLKALDEQLSSATSSASLDVSSDQQTVAGKEEEGLLPSPAPIVFTKSTSSSEDSKPKTAKKSVKKGINNLLDETRWKITLSIGREPGTWMPKTWGVSGQRLNLSFTAEFAPSQLFDRDDFLRGGYSNAKIFHVIDNKVTLGPSISEGQRVYNVRDGGWQVTRGDGPMGTDMLRFYIEIDEEINRGDVYVPKGRVYCSCGYFPCVKKGRRWKFNKGSLSERTARIRCENIKIGREESNH